METNALCDMKFADRVAASQIGDSFESYGCRVNDLSIDDLFGQYEKAGFLYPAKMKRLAPFLPLVKDNWRKARRAGELIQWVATFDNPAAGEWSSISSWLSTNTGWVTQHLVTIGSPLASRAVMLAGAAVRLTDGGGGSHQNWFRRGNRYANKIFGSSAGDSAKNTAGLETMDTTFWRKDSYGLRLTTCSFPMPDTPIPRS